MSKNEFLSALQKGLSGLPGDEIEERLNFYSEIIEDRMEEGIPEEEAVLAVGTVEEIVTQAVSEIPFTKIAKERIKPKRHLKVWEIVLLALGSPIWLSLGIAVVAVILALYVSVWSIIISLWAVFGSLGICSLAGVIAGIIFICTENTFSGIAMIGIGIVCAGISIFMYYGCKIVTKGILVLTKKLAVWIKNLFIKKEVA